MKNIDLGETIAQRIGALAREKGESVDFAAENISKQNKLLLKPVDAIMHGLFYYSVNNYNKNSIKGARNIIKDLTPATTIVVMQAIADYFDTTVDNIISQPQSENRYYTWNTEDKKYQGKEHLTYAECFNEATTTLIKENYKSIFIEEYEYLDVKQILSEIIDYYDFLLILEHIEKKIQIDYEADWYINETRNHINSNALNGLYSALLDVIVKFLRKNNNMPKIKRIISVKEITIGGKEK